MPRATESRRHVGSRVLDAHGDAEARSPCAAVCPRPMPDGSPDIVVAEGAVNFRAGADAGRVAAIVAALQQRPEVRRHLHTPTRRRRPRRRRPRHAVLRRRPVEPSARRRDSGRRPTGRARRTEAGLRRARPTQSGVAGHGTTSPLDVHIPLMAAGPDFREHAVSDVPTSNVDLSADAATAARPPGADRCDDRARDREGCAATRPPRALRIDHATETVRSADGSYELTAHISVAAGHRGIWTTPDVKRR